MEKSTKLQIRLTPSEKVELKRLADSRHISVSDYIRMSALYSNDNKQVLN